MPKPWRPNEQLRAQGMAVCLSTHQPEHALRVADREALMQAGCPRVQGRPQDVVTPESLCRLYGLQAHEIPANLTSSQRTREPTR